LSWPGYDLSARTTMLYDVECRTVDDPDATERALWSSSVH